MLLRRRPCSNQLMSPTLPTGGIQQQTCCTLLQRANGTHRWMHTVLLLHMLCKQCQYRITDRGMRWHADLIVVGDVDKVGRLQVADSAYHCCVGQPRITNNNTVKPSVLSQYPTPAYTQMTTYSHIKTTICSFMLIFQSCNTHQDTPSCTNHAYSVSPRSLQATAD